MKTIPFVLLLLAIPALAADFTTSAVSSSTPTRVTLALTGVSYKTVMVENGGSNPIYCSMDPAVTVNTGHKVAASDGWRAFPNDGPLWCIAGTASQAGTARDRTIVWGSYQ